MLDQASIQSSNELKIESYNYEHLRLGIVLDMSQSMYSGPCSDSVDVLIDNVYPLGCNSPTGVDPEGSRFQLVLKWIESLEGKIARGLFKYENVRVAIFPYSNQLMEKKWTLENVYNSRNVITSYSQMYGFAKNIGMEKEIKPGFISLRAAKYYVYLLWGVYNNLQRVGYPEQLPSEVVSALGSLAISNAEAATKSSSGTSVVAPALERLNLLLAQELDFLKSKNLGSSSYFEIAYISDGVPKPHPFHIEKVMDYVWRTKKEVCDITEYGAQFRSCADDTSVETGWKNIDASVCSKKCSDYVRRYVDEGGVSIPEVENSICTTRDSNNKCLKYSIPGQKADILSFQRWSSVNVTCSQCFEVLKQYKYNNSSCLGSTCAMSFKSDTFKSDITQGWGDWVLNNHAVIIQSFKDTQSLFVKKYTDVKFHMNFIRINANILANQTQPGELVKEINWMNKAYDFFGKTQRFLEFKSVSKVPELFPDFSDTQKYQLGAVYILNKNVKTDSLGNFNFDADADGISDDIEVVTSKFKLRTDNVCLDSVVSKFTQCMNVGCNPNIDNDFDGLNECEEKTYGTDDFNPDSDGDSIIDYDEVIMGYNPRENDKITYFNSDGYSNFDHFIKGLSYKTNLNSVSNEKKIEMSVNFLGFKNSVNNFGLKIEVPIYSITVKNIPYVHTHDQVSKNNEVTVRIRIDDVNNVGNNFWYTKSYFIDSQRKNIIIDLSEFKRIDLRDLK